MTARRLSKIAHSEPTVATARYRRAAVRCGRARQNKRAVLRRTKVFRDCQLQALHEQSKARAATKVKHAESVSGQREIFESLHEMAPNDLETKLAAEKAAAERLLLEMTPLAPSSVAYEAVWPRVLAKHIVRLPDVNQIAARLRKEERLYFPDSEQGKRVPQSHYRMQRR